MNTVYEVHDKTQQFNCCNTNCTNILCSDCLIYSDKNSDYMSSSLFFYCHKCIAKAKDKRTLVLCQPVNYHISSNSLPPSDKEDIEKYNYSNITVQLFPETSTATSDNFKNHRPN